MAVTREAAEAQAIPAHHQPIAVVLDFVNPERAGRRSHRLRWQARLNEAGGSLQEHGRRIGQQPRNHQLRAAAAGSLILPGRCLMTRSRSSLAARTRKTRLLHEIRHRPPLCRPRKSRARILEIANAVEPIQGRIHIEKVNEPFLFRDGGSPAQNGGGMKLAVDRGWLTMHESGPFVTFTPAGAELFD
jgi:hypothetical protein